MEEDIKKEIAYWNFKIPPKVRANFRLIRKAIKVAYQNKRGVMRPFSRG